MADLRDVANAFGATIGAVLYPEAPTTAEQASLVAGVPVLVYVGWPDPKSLGDDLKCGKAHISIYPLPGERNTTRAEEGEVEISTNDATWSVDVDGQVVTVSGAQPDSFFPHNLLVLINRRPYAVQTAEGVLTAADLAAQLGALITADLPGTAVAGADITVPGGNLIDAVRVGTTGSTLNEYRSQERMLQISVWSSTPETRDKIAAAIDIPLAKLRFLSLSDGSLCRVHYRGSPFTDFDKLRGAFRRDFIYAAEYATAEQASATQIINPTIAVTETTNG